MQHKVEIGYSEKARPFNYDWKAWASATGWRRSFVTLLENGTQNWLFLANF